jgi:hypothetical protein
MNRAMPPISALATVVVLCAAAAALFAGACRAADSRNERQAQVSHRGVDVMPFDASATMHVFSKTSDGGIQRVIAKDPADAKQVRMIRAHLRELRARFARGDWSGPKRIHGDNMPGLARLERARTGQLSIAYADAVAGGQLTYRSRAPDLVEAIHHWFDAQLSDHGPDAMEERHHPDRTEGGATR